MKYVEIIAKIDWKKHMRILIKTNKDEYSLGTITRRSKDNKIYVLFDNGDKVIFSVNSKRIIGEGISRTRKTVITEDKMINYLKNKPIEITKPNKPKPQKPIEITKPVEETQKKQTSNPKPTSKKNSGIPQEWIEWANKHGISDETLDDVLSNKGSIKFDDIKEGDFVTATIYNGDDLIRATMYIVFKNNQYTMGIFANPSTSSPMIGELNKFFNNSVTEPNQTMLRYILNNFNPYQVYIEDIKKYIIKKIKKSSSSKIVEPFFLKEMIQDITR